MTTMYWILETLMAVANIYILFSRIDLVKNEAPRRHDIQTNLTEKISKSVNNSLVNVIKFYAAC